MVSFEEWLEEIRLFIVSDDEQHLYLGDPSKPRKTMVIINGPKLTTSIRVPPITSKNLDTRYPTSDIIYYSPPVQFLFILLGQQSGSLRVHQGNGRGTNGVLNVTFWEEMDENVSDDLPVTLEILKYIAGEIEYLEEMDYFLKILASTSRSERQALLTKLIYLDTPSSRNLVYYLFHFNDEYAIAILREYGRHGIQAQYIIDWAKRYVTFQDKGYRRFARYYLLRFSPEYLRDHGLDESVSVAFREFMNYSVRVRMQRTVDQLKSSFRADGLKYLENLNDDPEQLFLDVRYIQNQMRSGLIEPKDLTPALIDLLQFAETTGSPRIAGVVLSFLSFQDVVDDETKETTDSLMDGIYYYVTRRLISLLRVWLHWKKRKQIEEFVLSFMSTIPGIKIGEIEFVDINEWLKKHQVLKILRKHVNRVINKEENVVQIGFHSAFIRNEISASIVRNYFLKNNLPDKYSLETNLALVGAYPAFIDFPTRLPKLIGPTDIPHFLITPVLLRIVEQAEVGVSGSVVKTLTQQILLQGESSLQILKDYIKMLGRSHKDLLPPTFETIIKIIDDRYDPEVTNIGVERFIENLIIPWNQITNSFAEDWIQQAIDSYKILFQDRIEDFDLESSRTLDIETIVRSYQLSKGEIMKFIESNIQFSFTKPVWEQLARHYLALGIHRPKREAIGKSKLKEVPAYLTRDILGQIAIVNQTLNYSERNGFRHALENLIITNIYRRGWNVERGMERTLPALFGATSPRLRSYLTAYLVIDQGEIHLDLLQWARDVEIFSLRERLVRELERYGTPDMWVVLAGSYHQDLQDRALQQLKEARMSPESRSGIVVDLLESSQPKCRSLGRLWLNEQGIEQKDLGRLFYNYHPDNQQVILHYLKDHRREIDEDLNKPLYDLLNRLAWKPKIGLKTVELASSLVVMLENERLRERLGERMLLLSKTGVGTKIKAAMMLLSELED